MSGLPDGSRLVVTGNPTAEETAAVVVALDTALAHERGPAAQRRRGWQEAARREAVGGRLVRTRVDLDAPLP